jgi:hypothetical protein
VVRDVWDIHVRYFIVTYAQKPDGRFDEQVEVSKYLKNRHRSANVILDFQTQTVEKARLEQNIEPNWSVIKQYYQKVYGDIITALEGQNPQVCDALPPK